LFSHHSWCLFFTHTLSPVASASLGGSSPLILWSAAAVWSLPIPMPYSQVYGLYHLPCSVACTAAFWPGSAARDLFHSLYRQCRYFLIGCSNWVCPSIVSINTRRSLLSDSLFLSFLQHRNVTINHFTKHH
jgi:hypothetical protein